MSSAKPDRSTYAGMLAVAVAAAVLSFSALSSLAELAGVSAQIWRFKLAWLLPIAIDAYAMTATKVWLQGKQSARTRKYARSNAVGAISLSVVGNGAYHYFASTGVKTLAIIGNGWLVVVLVSAVPPVILGLVGHLHALVVADYRDTPEPRKREKPTSPNSLAGGGVGGRVQRDGSSASVAPGKRALLGIETGATNRERLAGKASPVPAATPDDDRDSKGSAEKKMRDYWASARTQGRTPSGVELDRVAGTRDYGRKVRRTLLAEEAARSRGEEQDDM